MYQEAGSVIDLSWAKFPQMNWQGLLF